MSITDLSATIDYGLDHVCDAFLAALSTGQRPRIEVFLDSRPEPDRLRLLELLLGLELDFRKKAGEQPEPGEYHERFPTDVQAVDHVFESNASGRSTITSETIPLPSTAESAGGVSLLSKTLEVPARGMKPGDGRPGPAVERIGRYLVLSALGKSNFQVYLAYDALYDRLVAIKVALPDLSESRRQLMSLADEAERLQSLDHPRIVKLYEYVPPGEPGLGADGYIVLEYVAGRENEATLEKLFQAGRVGVERLLGICALVADTLHYAHTQGSHLVHRDLKPSNILLDRQGEPHVCDFGLTVDEEIQRLRRGEIAGTAHYMAPEQVRGETHYLDGRTDIWALGVILYRGLTGKKPFSGAQQQAIFEEILDRDPRPLRNIDPTIDPELERIVLRCLAKPMGERYLTAADLATDLKRVIARSPSPGMSEPVLYRGLRPFDMEDASFFLRLLPGPRRGDGTPESIRFWKDRIEALEGDRVFRIGLLFGPSGGGKSSFVRAGLLPSLDHHRVRPIVVEATPGGTEARLLAELRREVPSLPDDIDLVEAMARARDEPRRREAGKLFLVFDQFEHWLQAHSSEPDAELVRALRQCDGRRLGALLLVRDDFWTALTRFLRALDVPLVQGRNVAAIELFDARHTRQVLEAFGRTIGQLPGTEEPIPAQAMRFLDRAVPLLIGMDGQLIPIRLSLFIEVVKHREWTAETLSSLGGIDGIGVKYLDDCFSQRAYEGYRGSALKVLARLLPPPSAVIRGKPCGVEELQTDAGLAQRPEEFAGLIRALADELRLLAVAENQENAQANAASETHYQLAHDFLVRPVRQWVEREQAATPRGRAQLRFKLITAAWEAQPGPRQLPSLLEWLIILWHVPRREWPAEGRRLMRAAGRRFTLQAAELLAVCVGMGLVASGLLERARDRDVLARALAYEPADLRRLLPEVEGARSRLRAEFERIEADPATQGRRRTNALLLLHRFWPTDQRAMKLRAELLAADPGEVGLIRDVLAVNRTNAGADGFWSVLRNEEAEDSARLRAASALAALEPFDASRWAPLAGTIVRSLLAEDPGVRPRWLSLLGPARSVMVAPLSALCADPERDASARLSAAEVLALSVSAAHDGGSLADALTGAQPDASLVLLRRLEEMSSRRDGLASLEAQATEPGAQHDDAAFDRQAMAAVALAVLGRPDALRSALRHRSDPRLRTATIQAIATRRLAPRTLHRRLPWGELDASERQAVFLTWAETSFPEIPRSIRLDVLELARHAFVDDHDPGVHSAAELLIRRWDRGSLPALLEGAGRLPPLGGASRGWVKGPNGHTLVYVRGPIQFLMGSPADEPKRFAEREQQHVRRIERSLLVATTETTLEQYQEFKKEHSADPRYSQSLDCPVGGVTWYEGTRYCNWLSRKAGLKPFFPDDEIKPGMKFPVNNEGNGGFRYPTEAEWEYLCRAGTETCRPFGASDRLMDRYALTWSNSGESLTPAGRFLPNEFGLFDMLGSQWEWCLGSSIGTDEPYPSGTNDHATLDHNDEIRVDRNDYRYVRGGCFVKGPTFTRSAHRDVQPAWYYFFSNGFRVVRTVTPEQEPHN